MSTKYSNNSFLGAKMPRPWSFKAVIDSIIEKGDKPDLNGRIYPAEAIQVALAKMGPCKLAAMMQQITSQELYRVQTHGRMMQTRMVPQPQPKLSRHGRFYTEALFGPDAVSALKEGLWDPLSKTEKYRMSQAYKDLLIKHQRRIEKESRLKHAPYVLPEGYEFMELNPYSEMGRYLDYNLCRFEIADRKPRKKLMVNLLEIIYFEDDVFYTN